ncbi:MAG: TonB-dependent receptor, partial [bacterium]|nr:TonB-dependent receptor [bacterium]
MKAVFVLFTLFAATVFFPVKAFAFDVTGKVLSKETAEPLPGAAVGIEEPGAIEYTNSAGDFTFKDIKKGKYHLYIAHPEYENKIITVTVKKNFHIEVELGVRSFTGDTIDNRYYNAEDRFGGQYISGENIKDFPLRGAGDSLHLLQTLPGVGGGSYLSTVPIIRGGNPLYDRYYIDDIPVDFPYHYVGSIVPL